MRFKSKKSLGPYIPKRADANEKRLRLVASAIPDQRQLELYLYRVAVKPDYLPERRLEIQRAAFEAVRQYLKFQAVMPKFLQEVEPVATDLR